MDVNVHVVLSDSDHVIFTRNQVPLGPPCYCLPTIRNDAVITRLFDGSNPAMTRFRLQLCLLTVLLLCTCPRAILISSGLPSIGYTQHDHGHFLALGHTAALELKPGLQDHQAASRSLTQVNSSLPEVESASGSSNNAAPPDHKPLFPVSGLEVAVLVIAGVVLFIAAGKRA